MDGPGSAGHEFLGLLKGLRLVPDAGSDQRAQAGRVQIRARKPRVLPGLDRRAQGELAGAPDPVDILTDLEKSGIKTPDGSADGDLALRLLEGFHGPDRAFPRSK